MTAPPSTEPDVAGPRDDEPARRPPIAQTPFSPGWFGPC